MTKITQQIIVKGDTIEFEWVDIDYGINISEYCPITQAYGICVDKDGKVCLIKGNKPDSNWCLPGGTVEDGETLIETLKREVDEEADLEIEDIKFLGLQKVTKNNIFDCYQSRWVARISKVKQQTADPDRGYVLTREFKEWDEAINSLSWGPVADMFFEKAKQIIESKE